MAFSLKVWKFTITIKALDIDPSDRTLAIGIEVGW